MAQRAKYGRVLLKLSGESLSGRQGYGFAEDALAHYAREVACAVREFGAEVAIVLGGGNIFRGLQGAARGFARTTGDQMGMLATVINSLAVGQALKAQGVESVVYSATRVEPMAQPYRLEQVGATLRAGRVALLAGGTGNPFFTTDSAAALRAAELDCDALLKGTRVDGVYSADPEKDPSAVRYGQLTFREAYERRLHVMDMTAFTLCQENRVPVVVFDVGVAGNLARILRGEPVGTLVS